MLRIGKLTDYGVLLLADIASNPQLLRSATELADKHQLGAATVAKVLKCLSRAKLLETVRGSSGGYRLAAPPASISMLDVLNALEGPLGLTECSVHDSSCSIESDCGVRGHWQVISQAVAGALEKVTLADLLRPAEKIVPLSAIGGLSRRA